jgi:hypothetical protein
MCLHVVFAHLQKQYALLFLSSTGIARRGSFGRSAARCRAEWRELIRALRGGCSGVHFILKKALIRCGRISTNHASKPLRGRASGLWAGPFSEWFRSSAANAVGLTPSTGTRGIHGTQKGLRASGAKRRRTLTPAQTIASACKVLPNFWNSYWLTGNITGASWMRKPSAASTPR